MKYFTVNRMLKNPDLFCIRKCKITEVLNERKNCSFLEIKNMVSKILNRPMKSETIEELCEESKQKDFVLEYIEAFIA